MEKQRIPSKSRKQNKFQNNNEKVSSKTHNCSLKNEKKRRKNLKWKKVFPTIKKQKCYFWEWAAENMRGSSLLYYIHKWIKNWNIYTVPQYCIWRKKIWSRRKKNVCSLKLKTLHSFIITTWIHFSGFSIVYNSGTWRKDKKKNDRRPFTMTTMMMLLMNYTFRRQ